MLKELTRAKETIRVLPRDKEIVQLVANDKSRYEIAEILGLSKRTIEAELDSMRLRYGCKKPAGLVALFFRNNLIK